MGRARPATPLALIKREGGDQFPRSASQPGIHRSGRCGVDVQFAVRERSPRRRVTVSVRDERCGIGGKADGIGKRQRRSPSRPVARSDGACSTDRFAHPRSAPIYDARSSSARTADARRRNVRVVRWCTIEAVGPRRAPKSSYACRTVRVATDGGRILLRIDAMR